MFASHSSDLRWAVRGLAIFVPTCLLTVAVAQESVPTESALSGIVLDVRDFGAIGDGRVHPVEEWIRGGQFHSLRALQKRYPFVDDATWSVDEVAFAAALRELPPDGGTIHFPVGHYVAAKQPWKIWRDNVRLTGDGADRTILSTAATVPEGLSLAPYRHIGWIEGADREFPFAAESGARGEGGVQLIVPEWTREFQRGDLVFIRSGANRFDQDYGEFNEIAGIDAAGRLRFKLPLARDYTLPSLNWASEIAEDFTMPAKGASVRVALRTGEGYFLPTDGMTVTIGDNLFTVGKTYPKHHSDTTSVRMTYGGRGTTARGALVPAGTKVGKSRAILKVTRTTRNFRCENLQVIGRRKTLNLSNSYNSCFADCTFVRDLRKGGFQGGLTIDGDGGRFARFERCKIVALPAAGMQFARSFGSVLFTGCRFIDTNAAFTEFNFDCEVSRSTFEVTGGAGLSNVVVAGKSCGNLRFLNNQIRASHVAAIFDTHADIQSQKHNDEGEIVVRGNTIETDGAVQIFSSPKSNRLAVENNHITSR